MRRLEARVAYLLEPAALALLGVVLVVVVVVVRVVLVMDRLPATRPPP